MVCSDLVSGKSHQVYWLDILIPICSELFFKFAVGPQEVEGNWIPRNHSVNGPFTRAENVSLLGKNFFQKMEPSKNSFPGPTRAVDGRGLLLFQSALWIIYSSSLWIICVDLFRSALWKIYSSLLCGESIPVCCVDLFGLLWKICSPFCRQSIPVSSLWIIYSSALWIIYSSLLWEYILVCCVDLF